MFIIQNIYPRNFHPVNYPTLFNCILLFPLILFYCFSSKVCWFEPYTIFSGGMPRASYGDRHCISVICGDSTQATFDFTSRVVDFFIIFDKHDKSKKVLSSICSSVYGQCS